MLLCPSVELWCVALGAVLSVLLLSYHMCVPPIECL